MTKRTKVLSLLLALVMVISLMPTVALAAGGTDDFYRIVHLDCGRKYFSSDWIKALIDEASAAGYTQLQLAFGNDGLRFLLNDMTFTANGTTYDHATVVSKVEAGNKAQNSSGDARWLTEAEMDEIIAHANKKGIEIVPLLNLPGHANAILDIVDDAYNASGSNNTLNVASSDAAQEFGLAIFKKYVDYFAGKGCKFFNFGADEYANEASGTFSFSRLNATQYASFVSFINSMAEYIVSKGMTPRAFNDGLYYNGQTADIRTSIQCCYWSSGWSSYKVASASTISGKGHGMINTNGDFYYVLGKDDKFDSGYSYASNFSNTKFMGSTISSPVGSMFCIWCDYPNAETEQVVAQKVRLPLRAMAARMQDKSIDTINTGVISGGFNEDGSINVPLEDATLTDPATGVTVTAPGLTSLTVTAGEVVKSGFNVSKTYTITLNGGAYTGEATVKFPYDSAFDGCTGFYGMAGDDRFEVTIEDGCFAAVVPHLSDITINGTSGVVNLTVGESLEHKIDGANYADQVDTADLIEYIATVSVEGKQETGGTTRTLGGTVSMNSNGTYTGVISDGTNYLVLNGTTISSTKDINEATVWTVTRSYSNYTIMSGSYYLGYSYNYYSGYSLSVSNDSSNWSYNNGFYYRSGNGPWSTTYYLRNNGSWELSTTNSNKGQLYSYTETTTEPVNATTITFTGTGEGVTTVTVGGTEYIINVTAPAKAETKALTYGQTLTLPDGAEDVTITSGSDYVALDGLTVKAGNAVGTAVITFVTKNAGGYITAKYTYTINVTEIDLTTIDPLTIEYWITNGRPTANKDGTGGSDYSVSAADAYSETGIEITGFLPVNTYKEGTTTEDGRMLQYWRSRLLDKTLSNNSTSGTEEQTTYAGDDETYNGTGFTKVRYWNGTWAVYTDNNEWVSVASKHQLVAYYLEILPVADELDVNAADWGKKGDGSTSGDYLDPTSSCTISVQVVYEDGTMNPAGTTAADLKSSTIAYGYWTSTRGVGTLNFTGLEGYQIWKIEAETGAMTYDNSSSTWGSFTVSSFTWDNNAMTVYEGDPVDSYVIHNDANNPSKEGYYKNLMWDENYEAILIKVYVKAAETEDSLTVHYIDKTTGDEFYNYNIAVKGNVRFNANIGLNDPWKGPLANGTVTNSLNVKQTVSADLSTMPQIGAQYRYSDYTCVEVTKSDDLKEVFLYYTFSNTVEFVADYGLPISIKLGDLNKTLENAHVTAVEAKGAKYADVTVDETTYTVLYTPTKLISGADSFTVNVEGTQTVNGEVKTGTVGYTVYIYPATTVYYEDSFVKFTGDWKTEGTTAKANQAADKLGDDAANVYGYDEAYDSFAKYSLGSATKTTVTSTDDSTAWPTATFTFKGTGFDIISLTDSDSGAIFVTVTDKEGTAVKKFVVNNYYGYSYTVNEDGKGEWTVDKESSKTLYQVPVMKVSGLPYGEYDVEIKVAYSELFDTAKDSSYSFWLDAIRIYDPAGTTLDDKYTSDGEAKPSYQRIKSIIIDANTYNDGTDSTLNGAVFIDGMPTGATVKQYENYGPNNETYLANGQAVAFKLIATEQPKEVQIGVKLALGTSATVNGSLNKTLTTATDMYYQLSNLTWDESTDGKYVSSVITVGNTTGGSIVSLTNIKITGGAEFTTLDAVNASTGEEALAAAFVDAQTVEEAIKLLNETPEEPIAPNPGGEPTKPDDGETWKNPYADVDENAWYYEFVKSVSEKELMNGVETGFDPNGKLSRAMLVTILYRLSGAEKVEAEHKFEDVADNLWYTDAIAWAHANGIVNGYSETQFAPNREISRQELAAVIARYAAKYGIELKKADGTAFADDAAIADYARDAVYSLKASGILSGKGENSFDPLGTTTRAEAAKVIALLSTY